MIYSWLNGSDIVAVANADNPSFRPVKPSFSDVVALIEIRFIGRLHISANRFFILCLSGPIFGISQIIVTSRRMIFALAS